MWLLASRLAALRAARTSLVMVAMTVTASSRTAFALMGFMVTSEKWTKKMPARGMSGEAGLVGATGYCCLALR